MVRSCAVPDSIRVDPQTTSHRPRADQRGQGLCEQGEPPSGAAVLRGAPSADAPLRGRARALREDCYAGADPRYRLRVRIITDQAWHSCSQAHVHPNPRAARTACEDPEFTVIDVPACTRNRPRTARTRRSSPPQLLEEDVSSAVRATRVRSRSHLQVMNYVLPSRRALMHCSANVGRRETSRVLRLSGTGKTPLSSDPTAADRRRTSTGGARMVCSTRGWVLREDDTAVWREPSPRSTGSPRGSAPCSRT